MLLFGSLNVLFVSTETSDRLGFVTLEIFVCIKALPYMYPGTFDFFFCAAINGECSASAFCSEAAPELLSFRRTSHSNHPETEVSASQGERG